MSNFTTINKCRVCNSNNLQEILSLGNQAITGFSKEEETPIEVPLDLVLCDECKLLQLRHTTNPSLLYNNNYGYRSGVNQTMRDELRGIANKAEKVAGLTQGDIVVDIGCNDGTLLTSYETLRIKKLGFEPSTNVAKEAASKVDVVIDYFNAAGYFNNFPLYMKAKLVTAISMFYDLNDPNAFLADIKCILDERGVLVIQQNYLVGMLTQLAFDNICHEHLEYYSLLSLEKLLTGHGLEVFDVEERDLNGGSFRTYIQYKGGKQKITQAVGEMRSNEAKLGLDQKDIYGKFANDVWMVSNKLSEFVNAAIKKGKKVFVYGASTRGNTLLQTANLNYKQITFAAERNPDKYGQVMIGTDIPIISERIARRLNPDYFLVLPWFFKKEFIERESMFRAGGGRLIFPLPKFEVV